jgi:hypothetical protein
MASLSPEEVQLIASQLGMNPPSSKKPIVIAVLIAVILGILGGAALGWGLKPDVVRVEEKVKIVEVTKEVVVIQEQVRVEIVKVKDSVVSDRYRKTETITPDGTINRVEERNIDTVVKEKENTVEVKVVEVTKEVVVEKLVDRVIKIEPVLAQWRLGAGGGVQFLAGTFPEPTPILSVGGARRIAGPFWLKLEGSLNTKLTAGDIQLKGEIEF